MSSENNLNFFSITLTPPVKAFDLFLKGKNIISKEKLSTDELETYTNEFDSLIDFQKYDLLAKEKEDQQRYEKEIDFVEKHLIRPYHKKGITAEQLFIKTFIIEHSDKNDEDKEKKLEEIAVKTWEGMTNTEKQEWIYLKKENDILWTKMQNNEELSTYDYFCQTKMKEAFEIGKEIVVTDCDFLWKRLTKKKEKQYAAKADEENDKRKEYKKFIESNKDQDILGESISDSSKQGGYDLFIKRISSSVLSKNENKNEEEEKKADEKEVPDSSQEKQQTEEAPEIEMKPTKDKYFNFFKFASDLWQKLPTSEKQKYIHLAHKEHLIYLYRKKLYEEQQELMKNNNSNNNNSIEGYDVFLQKHKSTQTKLPEGQTPKKYYKNLYANLPQSEKDYYCKLADEINTNANEDNIQITPEKKAKTGINVFFEEVRFLIKQRAIGKKQEEILSENKPINIDDSGEHNSSCQDNQEMSEVSRQSNVPEEGRKSENNLKDIKNKQEIHISATLTANTKQKKLKKKALIIKKAS